MLGIELERAIYPPLLSLPANHLSILLLLHAMIH